MSLSGILIATAIVGGTGIFIGFFLGFAGKKFAVEVDEKEEAILAVLPGNNCGGCGYPGCSGLAAAIAKGEAPVNQCPVGGNPVGAKIAEIMGVEAIETERKVAFVRCSGSHGTAKELYEYTGVDSCKMVAAMQNGGPWACKSGCLGYGDCVSACQFGAIQVINGVSVVSKELCQACGKCVAACPKGIIELIPYKNKYRVACSSTDKGKTVMQVCQAGCIGCKLCEKECKFDAIHVINNVAVIDYDKCKNCGACARKCPRGIIRQLP